MAESKARPSKGKAAGLQGQVSELLLFTELPSGAPRTTLFWAWRLPNHQSARPRTTELGGFEAGRRGAIAVPNCTKSASYAVCAAVLTAASAALFALAEPMAVALMAATAAFPRAVLDGRCRIICFQRGPRPADTPRAAHCPRSLSHQRRTFRAAARLRAHTLGPGCALLSTDAPPMPGRDTKTTTEATAKPIEKDELPMVAADLTALHSRHLDEGGSTLRQGGNTHSAGAR